jgi:hypothetical protein
LEEAPRDHGAVEADMRGDPAPHAIGDDAEYLVEEKEKGDLQGGETLIVEVQDHQHVDGPVR